MQEKLFSETVVSFLKPVAPYLEDESVTEIMVNGCNEIYVERKGILEKTDVRFANERALMAAVKNIAQYVGRIIDVRSPRLDARLPDGSRVHVVIPPISRKGICMAIRKFNSATFQPKALLKLGSLSKSMLQFLTMCIRLRKNIVVAGGTSSGKTSLLNVLSSLIHEGDRIVVIEDSSELRLAQPHVLTMEVRPPDRHGKYEVTMRDILLSALRLRPDRVVIGEVRGPEALDLLLAMSSGHTGCLSSTHASSPYGTLSRLETLCLTAGIDMPLKAIRSLTSNSVEILVQTARFPDGARRITSIAEVLPLTEMGEYRIREFFQFIPSSGEPGQKKQPTFAATGQEPSFIDLLRARFTIPENFFHQCEDLQ